ncbi:hypothetical protein [Chryseobacterium mulctrae]|uniref:hypothetical protein n=1 Tax=Chryseobacterium mulctrae TaxID=2576777 RepID=UPI001116852C|nr:hypothetical protein [Chryseobacterium mulctrae]
MKNVGLVIFSFLWLVAVLNCGNSVQPTSDMKTNTVMIAKESFIDFSEVRRLNKDIDLKEFMILATFDQTLDLYGKLEDGKFSRSEPIPTLFDNEFFIVLKPLLKKLKYGDINVVRIEEKNSVLNVYYKEIKNDEYLSNKQKNPILILRLKGNIPSNVKLIPLNI